MNEQNQISIAQKILKDAEKALVLLPPEPSEDQVIGALSLHLSLKESGKTSQIGCATAIEVNPKILEVENISDTIGSRNLIISFNYNEDHLEKVDYDVRNDGRFYLVIKPKEGAPVPEAANVKFSYSGAEADLVIVLGINSLEELGSIYSEEKTFLDEANILSLNISPRPSSFTDKQLHQFLPSYSELVALLLESSGVTPSQSAASNLIFGIYQASGDLSSGKLTAETFSSLSYLMRSGGHLPNQHSHVGKLSQAPFFESPMMTPPQPEEDPAIPQDWKKPKIFRAGESPFSK